MTWLWPVRASSAWSDPQANAPCLRARLPVSAPAPREEGEEHLGRLIGDGEGLRSELAMYLKGLEPGALAGEISVNEAGYVILHVGDQFCCRDPAEA